MAGDAGDLRATLSLETKQFIDAMNDIGKKVEEGTSNASAQFASMQGFVDAIGGALAGLGIAGGVGKLADMALDAAAQVDKLHAAFVALNGATDETEKLFNDLQEIESKSPFDFEETLGPAAKSMLQMGVSTELTAKTIQGLVDTAAALKLTPDMITNVSQAMGVMNEHVTVTEKNMKTLSVNGIQAWDALAKKLNTDVIDAHEKVKAGVVSAQTVIEAVAEQAAVKWGGAAEKMTATWSGAMNQMNQATEDVLVDIGHAIKESLNALAPILTLLVAGVREFAEWLGKLPAPVKEAVIVFVGLAAALGSLAAALPAIITAVGAVGAAFVGWPLVVAAAVAALVLLGSWVKDNWEPIVATLTQAWEGLGDIWEAQWADAKAVFDTVAGWLDAFIGFITGGAAGLKDIWAVVADVWNTAWSGIMMILTGAWDEFKTQLGAIGKFFDVIVGSMKSFLTAIGGAKLAGLGDTWAAESQKAADAAAATGELTKTRKADAEAAAVQSKADKARMDSLNEYALLAKSVGVETRASMEANVAKAKETEKAMTESVKNGIGSQQDLVAAHKAVEKAEAELAAGGKDVIAARKAAEEAAKKQSEAEQKLAVDVRKGYETLKDVAPDVAAAFAAAFGGISENATKTAASFGTAWAKIPDDMKATIKSVVDLGDAFKTLGVTSQASLENSVAKAEDAYAKITASGKASEADLRAAAEAVEAAHTKLNDYITAGAKKSAEDVKAAYAALGEKSAADLDKSTADWAKHYAAIVKVAGDGSKEAAEAEVKVWEAARERLKKGGADFTDAQMAQFEALKQKVISLTDPVQKLADAYKTLGETPISTLTANLDKMAAALVTVKQASDSGKASSADLYAAQKKVSDTMTSEVEFINQKWIDAHNRGEISAREMYQHAVTAAGEMLAAVTSTGKEGPEQLAKITAATAVLKQAIHDLGAQTVKDTETAFHNLGVNTNAEFDAMQKKADEDYALIVASAGANSEQAKQAWVNKTKEAYGDIVRQGGTLTEAQKSELDRAEAQLQTHLTTTGSMWKTAYDGVKSAVGGAFDDIIDKLVTGKGSFKDIMTGMWQDIATAALHSFIDPVKKAVSDFIANEIADLLGGKGLGGILDGFKSIGKAATDVMGGAGDAVKGAGGAAGSVGGAGSAAGGVASAAGGMMGMVNMVSGVVSAITGVIGIFQSAHQETSLNAIEHNTRFSMMYLGDRSDGGILGVLFKIHEEVSWGANTKAIESLRDAYLDWKVNIAPPIYAGLRADIQGVYPYLVDLKSGLTRIEESVRSVDNSLKEIGSNIIQTMNVNVKAEGITTKEAADQLANQIASNLASQMVAAGLR